MSTSTDRATGRTVPLIRLFQVSSVLAALNVLGQFVTAGQMFPQGGPEAVHRAGAVVLHVLTGLGAVSAVVLWRLQRVSGRLMLLAVAVFGFTFVQAATGGRSSLWIHVPGASIMVAGIVWQLVVALRMSATPDAA